VAGVSQEPHGHCRRRDCRPDFSDGIFAPWIAPYDPLDQDPIFRLEPGNEEHWLGTDDFGRDVLSRLIWGSRISLVIGFASVLIGMLAGTALGMIAGYYRGRVETLIMRGIDVVMSFPDLILAVAITAALGATLVNLVITLGIVMTPGFARMAHSALLSMREREFVLAAQSIGARDRRIIFKHIFPTSSANFWWPPRSGSAWPSAGGEPAL